MQARACEALSPTNMQWTLKPRTLVFLLHHATPPSPTPKTKSGSRLSSDDRHRTLAASRRLTVRGHQKKTEKMRRREVKAKPHLNESAQANSYGLPDLPLSVATRLTPKAAVVHHQTTPIWSLSTQGRQEKS